MNFDTTQRGFAIGEFEDADGVKCSLQESSRFSEEETGSFIWLGASEIGLIYFVRYKGWQTPNLQEMWPEADSILANTRMHLSQENVKALLPALQHFAEHGQLPLDKERSDK